MASQKQSVRLEVGGVRDEPGWVGKVFIVGDIK